MVHIYIAAFFFFFFGKILIPFTSLFFEVFFFLFFFIFFFVDNIYNTSHKFWDQPPSPHYQCCLQVFGTVCCCKLWRCFSSNILQHWVGGRGLVYFCKVDHSRISKKFFRNWLGLDNSCEILWLVSL